MFIRLNLKENLKRSNEILMENQKPKRLRSNLLKIESEGAMRLK